MRDQNRCVTLVKLYPRGFRLLVIRLVAANVPVANVPLANVPSANVPVTDKSVVLEVKKTIGRKKQTIICARAERTQTAKFLSRGQQKKLFTHEPISHRRKTCVARAKKLFAHDPIRHK
jgi:hypothetical protein